MFMFKILSLLVLTFSISIAGAYETPDKTYKEGFVNISKLDSSIIINLKYTHSNNILNKKA